MNKKVLKNILFFLLTVILVFIFVELFSFAGLLILKRWKNIEYVPLPEVALTPSQTEMIRKMLTSEPRYFTFDPQLGWSLKPLGKENDYSINSQRIRADQEYTPAPPPGKIRIATFGDSFTFGVGVTNEMTWQSLLEKLDPRFEVMNFGVAGYGQDQAYLRYLDEGRQYRPHIVVIGFMSENVFRNVNVFRAFYSPKEDLPLTKPRFILDDGQLKLLENPFSRLSQYNRLLDNPRKAISELSQHDAFYQQSYHRHPWDNLFIVRLAVVVYHNFKSQLKPRELFFEDDVLNTNSEVYKLAARIMDDFCASVKADGAIPVIVVLPAKRDLSALEQGREKRYRPLLNHWRQEGHNLIDLNDSVLTDGIRSSEDKWFTSDGHNSALLHELMARHLYDYLNQAILGQIN